MCKGFKSHSNTKYNCTVAHRAHIHPQRREQLLAGQVLVELCVRLLKLEGKLATLGIV
jgi:hypothetical protein